MANSWSPSLGGRPLYVIACRKRPKRFRLATSKQVSADESGALSVIFRNMLEGEEVDRYMVLLPGASSFELDITQR